MESVKVIAKMQLGVDNSINENHPDNVEARAKAIIR